MRPGHGEIWVVDLDPVRPGEPGKDRPCVVISNNSYNAHAPALLVLPISTYQATPVSPLIHASIRTGLAVDSSILSLHIRAVVRSRFQRRIGRASQPLIEECVKILNEVL